METKRFCLYPIAFPRGSHRPSGIKFVLILGLLLFFTGNVWAKENPTTSGNGWFVNMNRFSQGAHTGITCAQCHGTMKEGGQAHPDYRNLEKVNLDTRRIYDYDTCKNCHRVAHARVGQGVHAEALVKEKTEGVAVDKTTGQPRHAPNCGDCHSSHYDRSHLSRSDLGKVMIQRCGECHQQQLETYLANYHGKAAAQLDHERAAFCTDCHGAHTAHSLKSDDKQLLATCRSCHPDAGPAFASVVIHYKPDNGEEKSPQKAAVISRIHWISVVSLIFVVVLLFCFYSHSFMLQLRKLHDHLRKKP